jgi:Methyltransferase domain
MSFSIHTVSQDMAKTARFEMFLSFISPSASDVLLDVGGYPGFWTSYPPIVKRLDSINVHEVPWDKASAPDHNITTLVGDGCSLPMEDQSYDIGFSNSVIEHVGSWERQQQFALEIRRVAKALWVQTPAYECPIEPHYLTPLIHYLSRSFQKKILRSCTVWGWIERPSSEKIHEMVETTQLLSKSKMRQIFPDCEIITERMLWIIPKSYIAIRRKA